MGEAISAPPGPPDFPAALALRDPVLIASTFASDIWKVTRADGSAAVVKSLRDFPDVWDELRGAHFLGWRNGVGAVKLLANEGRMMLLEHGGERLLADVIGEQGDSAATEIAADVLDRLAAPTPRPVPPELQPLRERFASLFAKGHADQGAGRASDYVEAAALAEMLLGNQQDVRPLHGDLHHENVIFGDRGWLAIDPKGVLGDPAFDAANMFSNPLGEQQGLCLAEDRIAFMAETYGKNLRQAP